jgi:integrase
MAPPDSQQQPKLLTQLRRVVHAKHTATVPRRATSRGCGAMCISMGCANRPSSAGRISNRFLSALAESGRLSASSQTQALSAVLFLYRDVLHQDVGNIGEVIRAKQPVRLPVVLTREEVRAVLGRLEGGARIAGLLMYGGGLRLLETLQLRVKDVDFLMRQIVMKSSSTVSSGTCRWPRH